MERPFVVATNDDGIDSRGLWAVVEALLPLGEVIVVAPDRQWSGAGRSVPQYVTGRLQPASREINGEWVTAYAVDATPALAVIHAVLELASRRPALVVSGINFGTNLGTEVTLSGTVGAALEAAAFGIPALAVSLETDPAYHFNGDDATDFSAAMAWTRRFAWHLLTCKFPEDVDVLNLNIPCNATVDTPWRSTRLSRHRYFLPTPPNRAMGESRPSYKLMEDPTQVELDSDIWAVKVERIVSVTPLSLDLTSRVPTPNLRAWLGAPLGVVLQLPAHRASAPLASASAL